MDGLHGAQIARSRPQREQLAKEWLLRLIERTPTAEVGDLPVAWIVAEAPDLIAEIFEAVDEPRSASATLRTRAAAFTRLRTGPDAAEQIPRDLAILQGLLVETLRAEPREGRGREFAYAVERLVAAFGEIHAAIGGELSERHDDPAAVDRLTGLPGRTQLTEWMRALLAEQRRYGHVFALALIDIEGLGRINDAFGREAGDRLVSAVADVIRRQVRSADQAFRLDEDEFAVVAPHCDVAGLLPMAERIAQLIDGSQAREQPRIAVAIGIAACPGDGETGDRLLEAATAASYAAKAAGVSIATSPDGPSRVLQDP